MAKIKGRVNFATVKYPFSSSPLRPGAGRRNFLYNAIFSFFFFPFGGSPVCLTHKSVCFQTCFFFLFCYFQEFRIFVRFFSMFFIYLLCIIIERFEYTKENKLGEGGKREVITHEIKQMYYYIC